MKPSLISRRETRAICPCAIIFALVITAVQVVGVWVAGAAGQDREPVADSEATLVRMRELHQQRKWRELIDEFAHRDFADWPAQLADKASEAFHLRGQSHSSLRNGRPAEADFQAALKYRPQNALIWLSLADNYTNNLHDDQQALAAYRQVVTITGKSNNWLPLTATLATARILTDQVKTNDALDVLRQHGDLSGMAPVWRIRFLRAYGHVYAAQGKEQESLAKFREALEWESRPDPR